jgi:hypothetical protein
MCFRFGTVCFSYRRLHLSSSSDQCSYVDVTADHGLGILRLELGKEKFEQTGLMGKPIRSGGRKHAKDRFGM